MIAPANREHLIRGFYYQHLMSGEKKDVGKILSEELNKSHCKPRLTPKELNDIYKEVEAREDVQNIRQSKT